MHNHMFETRWLQDSFAVVEVPDQPNVDVYANNQLVERTNSSGVAMVPWLVPYDCNIIRIDDRSLALNTILDSILTCVVRHVWRDATSQLYLWKSC